MAPPDPRPDPDALLAQARREGRGRLKIFLGAAPGVGKTVEMLTEARRLQAAGRDVLVGLVETHGRAETEAAIGTLPLLPRRDVPHGGQLLAEFDLDAALQRRPDVLLVDELAHSNAPGSRHAKRWQDVEELRDAGIEVWTAMNVQHLESAAEAVARVTGVRVREQVPDAVLEAADAVELVDIPPAELLERLRQGRIYRPDQAERALRGFFREGALDALRELALRRVAQRVDADVTGWMRRNAVPGPWPVGARVLALLPGGAAAEPLLRAARALADALRAPLLALHVERPGRDDDPGPGIALAQSLGAETEVTAATDLPAAVLAHARQRNCTHLVIGRGRPAAWRRWTGRTLTGRLTRLATDFTLHVVPAPGATPAPPPAAPRRWQGWALAPLLPALAALACHLLDGVVHEAAFGMVFLLAVLALAALAGPAQAVAGTALSFVLWNMLFLPPRYTLAIASPQDVLGAVVFALVALILAGTTGRLGRNVRAAAARLAALRRLSALTRRLNAGASPAALQEAVAEEAARLAAAPAALLLPLDEALAATLPGLHAPAPDGPPEPVPRVVVPPEAALDEAAMAAARWAMAQGRPAGNGTGTLPGAAWRFLPLSGPAGPLLGLRLEGRQPDPEAERAIQALLDQAAVALERARLSEEAAALRARRDSEALRTALLTSLGHDLRTPLTAIRGAAETLRSAGPALSAATRADLLHTVEEEAARLARWITAILDLVRLESGEVQARRERLDLPALLAEARDRAARLHPGSAIAVEAEGVPAPLGDEALLGRVLENLLDNALKYSAGPVTLRARREGAAVSLAVEDAGPGIPPAELPRVFDPFFRAGRADRVAAGTGLGLAICKGLTEAMGGTIRAESPLAAGGGTRVSLRLPL